MKGLKAGTEIFTILFAFGEKIWKVEWVGFCESVFLFICGQTDFFSKQTENTRKQTLHGSNVTKAPTLKGPANEMNFLNIFIDTIRFGTGPFHNYLNLFNFDF